MPNITSDCTVVARFDAIVYLVSGSKLAGTGTGTISPASRNVGYGGAAVFTITAGAGFVAGIDASGTCAAGTFAPDGVTYTVTGIVANCTVVARFDAEAALSIAKTHAGSFPAGGSGSYTITVSNTGGVATVGAVSVTDNAPAGMTVTAMSGTGWTCATLPTCTRGDALGAGAAYPDMAVTVAVAVGAGSPLVNSATASGGGSASATTTDSTTIVAPPVLAMTKTHSGSFVAGASGTYTLNVSNSGGSATTGTVTVTDAAPAGMTVTAMSGTGWTCTTLPTCTRGDALAAGGSYPAITVTVGVAGGAGSPLVNSASASGGGSSRPHRDRFHDDRAAGGARARQESLGQLPRRGHGHLHARRVQHRGRLDLRDRHGDRHSARGHDGDGDVRHGLDLHDAAHVHARRRSPRAARIPRSRWRCRSRAARARRS